MPKTRPLKIEQQVLKELNANPHANSGSMVKKHDGSDTGHVYEIKSTTAKSFSIKEEYWQQIKETAISRQGREPVLIIVFDDNNKDISSLEKLAVIPLECFNDFKQHYECCLEKCCGGDY